MTNIKAVLFLAFLSIFGVKASDTDSHRSLQSSSECPTVKYLESYKASYQQSGFAIKPTLNLACSGSNTYQVTSVQITNINGMVWSTSVQGLIFTDWSLSSNNAYYNVGLVTTLKSTSDTKVVESSFYLVIGKVDIQHSTQLYYEFNYKDTLTIDFTSAFDPEQPISGSIQVAWVCPSNFVSCTDFGKLSILTGLQRFGRNKMLYGQQYTFTVTLSNQNLQYFKTLTLQVVLNPIPPENTDSPPSCLTYDIMFANSAFQYQRVSQQYTQVLFDNLNQTEIRINTPQTSLASCQTTYYNNNRVQLLGAQMDETALFATQQMLVFDGASQLVIPSATLQAAFKKNNIYVVKFYTLITDPSGIVVRGNSLHYLILSVSSQSLYAAVKQNNIVVAKDKILYIDGSASYDARNFNSLNVNYIWKSVTKPSLVFEDTKILTLVPDTRTTLGINSPGLSYNYSLQIKDTTRISEPTYINVQIAPDIDPSNCLSVNLKDINVDQIVTYTWFPLLLQAKVTKSCSTITDQIVYWECTSLNWQFFQYFGNNFTIAIDRDTLTKLPKSVNINMRITVLYKINGIQYMAKKDFTLFVAKPDLIALISYPNVVNVNKDSIYLDASKSYDPAAESAGTTNIPVVCTWTCPTQLAGICSTLTGCKQTINRQSIMASFNYYTSIQNQMLQFKLSLTKDTRQTIQYVFVTVVDSTQYQNVTFSMGYDFALNNDVWINAAFPNAGTVSTGFTYQWKVYQWSNLAYLTQIDKIITTEQSLRIPPYFLNTNEFLIILTVIANGYSTSIGLYQRINDPSQFTTGQFAAPFNSFTSYISTFQITPTGWSSTTSYALYFQFRIKEADQQFRVLMSQTEADSTTALATILPPFTYEKILYVDVLDTDGNWVTSTLNIQSNPDQILNPSSLATRINAIVNSASNSFNENNLELNFYKLSQYFQAYALGHVDQQNYPVSYFRILSEISATYLDATLTIDKRLNDVLSAERIRIIKQHAIEAVYFMTTKHRDLQNSQTVVSLLNTVTPNSNFYLGAPFLQIATKAIGALVQSMDNYQSALQDTILKRLLTNINSYLVKGESSVLTYNGMEFRFQRIKPTYTSIAIMSDLGHIDQSVILSKIANEGFVMVLKNSTFIAVEVYDKNMIQQTISGTFNTPFYLDSALISSLKQAQSNVFCGTRSSFSNKISLTGIPSLQDTLTTRIVICKSSFLNQNALVRYYYPSSNPDPQPNVTDPDPLNPNSTDDPQNNNGTFVNNTNNFTDISNATVYQKHPYLLPIGEVTTFGIFIVSTIVLYKVYKNDKQSNNDHQQQYVDMQTTLFRKRWHLFKVMYKSFNPYLNLFLVPNKFLPRWIRNTALQTYFMLISLYYMVIGIQVSKATNPNDGIYVGFLILALLVIMFARPLLIGVYYKFLYEPFARVEDYELDSKRSRFSIEDSNKQNIVEEYEVKEEVNLSDVERRIEQSEQKPKKPPTTKKLDTEELPYQSQKQKFQTAGESKGEKSVRLPKIPAPPGMGRKRFNKTSKQAKSQITMYHDNEEYKENTQFSERQNTYDGLGNQTQNKTLPGEQGEESLRIVSSRFLDGLVTGNNSSRKKSQDEVTHYQMEGGEPEPTTKGFDKLPPINFTRNLQQAQTPGFGIQGFQERTLDRRDSDEHNGPSTRQPQQEHSVENPNRFEIDLSSELPQPQNDRRHNSIFQQFSHEPRFEDIEEVSSEVAQEDGGDRVVIDLRQKFYGNNSMDRRTEHSPQVEDELDQENHTNINKDKKLYINKIIGKAMLGIVWCVLVIAHLGGLRLMKPHVLNQWAIISVVTYLIMLFVVDPILYMVLSIVMQQEGAKTEYFLKKRYKRKTARHAFVWLLIGKEKMRDLRRALVSY